MNGVAMPRTYSDAELERIAKLSAGRFVEDRHCSEERLSAYYHECFEEAYRCTSEVLSRTDDLVKLKEEGQPLLTEGFLHILRSMNRPTVSEDDFKSLSDVGTVAPSRFSDDALSASALDYLGRNLNADIFPWLKKGCAATGRQRDAACVAVAALIADQRTKTSMRGQSSNAQEGLVRETLARECDLEVVDGSDFRLSSEGPGKGQLFRRETKVAGTKADVVLGLYDGRIMCLECKVSNSEVNSYKRLNHEAVDKVSKWRRAFGEQCVSGAVLQGCFKAANLISAQSAGAFLFWSSDLSPLVDFVNSTRGNC